MCKYDGKTYEKGTLLKITSEGKCHLHQCKGGHFLKVKLLMHCDGTPTCDSGWLPGCCDCKRKSEFAFTILLKSYISAVTSYIVTQILFSFSFVLFHFSPFSNFHYFLELSFPVFTLRFQLTFDCLILFLRTLFIVNTHESIFYKLFILESFQHHYLIAVKVHHSLHVLHSLEHLPYSHIFVFRCKMVLTSLHDFHGSCHLYICRSRFGNSTFFVASLVFMKGTSCVIRRNFK